jgi:hypothetical protein
MNGSTDPVNGVNSDRSPLLTDNMFHHLCFIICFIELTGLVSRLFRRYIMRDSGKERPPVPEVSLAGPGHWLGSAKLKRIRCCGKRRHTDGSQATRNGAKFQKPAAKERAAGLRLLNPCEERDYGPYCLKIL